MKVSILVPVYGVEKYIEQCAVSLFEQTYEDIEYIFVDDCTLDKSFQILESTLSRYPHRIPQVRIVRHDHNRGLGAARKTALAASTGEFVLNVDSDDYLMPKAVEQLMDVQHRTKSDIVSGSYQTLSPDGALRKVDVPFLGKELTLKLLLIQNTLTHNIWARLIKKSVYTDNDIDSIEGVNMAEDYCLTPRLILSACSLSYVSDVVYVYRLGSTSGTFHNYMRPHHIISILKANETVRQYVVAHDVKGIYSFAMATGMLNTYFIALSAGFSHQQIKAICPYTPQGIFKLFHLLFVHKATLRFLRLSYLAVKWFYKRHLGVTV